MTIIRTVHDKNNPYLTINTTITKDIRLTWKAKGIWFYAFSRPDDWMFFVVDIVNQSKDGREAVQNGLKELQEYGYLHKTHQRDKGGKFTKDDWTFYETPREPTEDELKESLPQTGFPSADKPCAGNTSLLSNKYNQLLSISTIGKKKSISLTEDQKKQLIEKHGEKLTERAIVRLNEWKEEHPKDDSKATDYGRINRWVIKAIEKDDLEERAFLARKKQIEQIEQRNNNQESSNQRKKEYGKHCARAKKQPKQVKSRPFSDFMDFSDPNQFKLCPSLTKEKK